MPKAPMSYKSVNKLADMLKQLQATRLLETGKQPLINDLIEELADYCEVSANTIKHLRKKNSTSQASLALALMMARFFGCQVEDIFELDNPKPLPSSKGLGDGNMEKGGKEK